MHFAQCGRFDFLQLAPNPGNGAEIRRKHNADAVRTDVRHCMGRIKSRSDAVILPFTPEEKAALAVLSNKLRPVLRMACNKAVRYERHSISTEVVIKYLMEFIDATPPTADEIRDAADEVAKNRQQDLVELARLRAKYGAYGA
jgi:hypothetical protein